MNLAQVLLIVFDQGSGAGFYIFPEDQPEDQREHQSASVLEKRRKVDGEGGRKTRIARPIKRGSQRDDTANRSVVNYSAFVE